MISAKDMQKVFQINWVKKLINQTNSKWAMIPYNEFNQLGGELSIFHSNLEFRDIKGLHLIKSVFWKSVLSTWVEVNSNENVVEDCIPSYKQEAQRLWNNNMISFKGKPLFFPQWVKAGIYKLGHLFNEEGEFLTMREISNIVGKSPSLWFEYNALFNAIPLEWKGKSNVPQSSVQPQYWDKDLTSYTNKMIRAKINSLKYSRPCSVAFWEKKFNIEYDRKMWKIPMRCTKEIRLQCLQWKILHNIYPTSIMLYKMKLRETTNCPYCPYETDFIEHFFFTCKKCVPSWKHVENILNVFLGQRVNIDVKMAILGLWKADDMGSQMVFLVNWLLLIGKMCISKFKYGTSYDIITMFDYELRFRRNHLPNEFKNLLP